VKSNIHLYPTYTPENLYNSRIPEEGFRTSMINSTPVDCEEESNQTYLRIAIQSYLKILFKNQKERTH